MRGVVFDVSVPRYLLARSVGRWTDAVHYGSLSGVRLRDREPPPLPRDDWVHVDVLAAGICGTDLGNLSYAASPALEPFASFPAVLGHEILGRIRSVGPAVQEVRPGQRVAVDPVVSCTVRGHAPGDRCSSCASGRPATCHRAGERGPLSVDGEPLAPGFFVGYHRQLPGGWGEGVVVHESQLHPVPDALDDRAAVLVEPLAIATHAVLQGPPTTGPVLVIGSGSIALSTVWALRASGYEGPLLTQVKRPHEADLARRLGADETVAPGDEAREALLGTGATPHRPMIGPEVYAGGGFPVVFDCVGSAGTLSQALRYAAPRARIVLLGCAARMRSLDLTFVWARELRIEGYVGYGSERVDGRERHTFEVTMERMAGTGAPLSELVTHVFPLEQYRDALAAAANHRRSGAVKVVLTP